MARLFNTGHGAWSDVHLNQLRNTPALAIRQTRLYTHEVKGTNMYMQLKKIWLGLGMGLLATTAVMAADIDPASVTVEQIRAGGARACAGGKKFTIAYDHSTSEAAIVKQVKHFASARAAELGCVTMMYGNTLYGNLEQQINALQGWITLGIDAIVITPIDESALKPLQRQAQAKGIKWLTYLGTMEGSDGYVGFNHAQSGQLISQAAVDWVRANHIQNAKAFLTTLTALPSLSPRWLEAEKILTQAGIQVVAMLESADQTSGMTVTETILRQHPDLSIVIGLNDDAAVGAYRAAKIAGRNDPKTFFIGGQDGSFEGLSAINDGGVYRASAAILINDLGANIVDLALNAVTGQGPSFGYTPTVLATKQDQAQLDALLANYGEYK